MSGERLAMGFLRVLGYVLFLLIGGAIMMANGQSGGLKYLVGGGFILVGMLAIVTRKVDVGFGGAGPESNVEPTGTAEGSTAVLIGFLAIGVGLLAMFT